ncbi:MAG: alpha/beta hydrolase, partial [Atribacterota bacterium]|nr:alpha/beta hydrolase [Atribacterota bacterium]
LIATIDSPDQGVTGIPVEQITLKENNLSLQIPSIGGFFQGKVNEDFTLIEGAWQQLGTSFNLSLHRVEKSIVIIRPQEPKKPYPYNEEEVKYENKVAGITLAGTLTLPDGGGLFPAVVLISGSGPQDRDEAIVGHRPFLVLADYLTRQGIAVLRFDDRGVGESEGNFDLATSEDFATDVLAGIAYLKNREEINSKQIGLIGHSEGGLIAPMVAAHSSDVGFIVLMAGPGLRGEEILYLQSALISKATGTSEEEIIRNRRFNERAYTLIKEEENQEIVAEQLYQILMDYFNELSKEEKDKIGDIEAYINVQMQSLLSPWFRYFLIYDPAPTLSKVKCPVLAINGEKDLQVPPSENLSAIEEALIEGGNKDFVIKEFPGLNHLFQTAETGSPDEYARIEETISPVVLKYISDWIWAHLYNN